MDKHQESVEKAVSNVRSALLEPKLRPSIRKYSAEFEHLPVEIRRINIASLTIMVTVIYGWYLYDIRTEIIVIVFRLIIVSGSVILASVFTKLILDWVHERKGEVIEPMIDPYSEWQTHYYKPLKKDIELLNKEFPEFKFKITEVGEIFLAGTLDFRIKIFDDLVATKLNK